MSKTPHEHFAAVNAQDTPELERNLEAARFWQMRDIDAGDYDPVVETFIETAEDALRFRDAAYMLDSPEDTPVKRISLLSRYVKHPVYFQEILETYVRDKAGLVGMSEEEKKELESAHYLIDKINSGKFRLRWAFGHCRLRWVPTVGRHASSMLRCISHRPVAAC